MPLYLIIAVGAVLLFTLIPLWSSAKHFEQKVEAGAITALGLILFLLIAIVGRAS